MVRAVVLVVFALLGIFWAALFVASWSVALSFYGWNLGPDGTTLIYVTPGRSVERAGIRVGDRIEWSSLPLLGRANLGLNQAVAPDADLHLTIHHGTQTRTVVLRPTPWPPIVQYANRALTLAGLILLAIGIALVYVRPSRMTWGFLLSSLVWVTAPWLLVWGQTVPWKFVVANGGASIFAGISATGILMFVARFPADRARGPLVVLDRIAVPLGILIAVLGLYIDIATLISPVPPPAWAAFSSEYLIKIVLIVLALPALTISYILTNGSERQRVVPVLAAFAFYVAAWMAWYLSIARVTDVLSNSILSMLSALSMVALAVAVAHGVMRSRVIDVSFAISRTVVYTALTSIVVGVFVLIDFISSKVLDRLQIALILEACAALAFGIWLNALHSRIDRFVDRVLFRRRHLAEAQLERTARTLLHAESASFVDEALVIEACDALTLASAAVFRRDGGELFRRVFARGWSEGELRAVSGDDHLIVHLLAELQAIDLCDVRWPQTNVPSGVAQPILVLPFVVRHEVLGFVLYGGHVGGEAIDPDEKRVLMRLADAASGAYEHVRSKSLLSEANELRTENTLLQHERELLREMVDALQNAGGRVER
jgi:hypothetical protein